MDPNPSRIISYLVLGVFVAGVTYIIIDFFKHSLHLRQLSESIVIRVQRNWQLPTSSEQNLAAQPQLNAIPVLIYGDALLPSEDTCSVCLGEYVVGEEVRVMPKCRHVFHRQCIDRWLTTGSALCPVCRERVVEGNDEGYQQRLEMPMLEIRVVSPTRML